MYCSLRKLEVNSQLWESLKTAESQTEVGELGKPCQYGWVDLCSYLQGCKNDSHGEVEARRHFCILSCPTSWLRAGCPGCCEVVFEQLSGHPVPASSHPQRKMSSSCLNETSSISIFTKKSLSLPSVYPSIKYLSLLIRFPERYYLQAVYLLCLEACCWLWVNFFISVCGIFFTPYSKLLFSQSAFSWLLHGLLLAGAGLCVSSYWIFWGLPQYPTEKIESLSSFFFPCSHSEVWWCRTLAYSCLHLWKWERVFSWYLTL